MESAEHGLPTATEIPRFDDGMVNIQELIRIMAEALVNEAMGAQAEDACADGNRRNGCRERTLVTSVGAVNLRIPKLRRGGYFPEDLLVRYSRSNRAAIAAVSEMATCGVSTRRRRPTPWHTSTFPMPAIAVCEPATCRSAPTASSSDAAAWRRCSRPGNRSSACWAQSSPRWTRAGRPEGGSRKSRSPRPLPRRSQPLLRLRMKGPPRSTQGASSTS